VSAATGTSVTVGVRPEDVIVSTTQGQGLEVTVDLVEELGADGYLYGHTEHTTTRTDIVVRVDGRLHPKNGETVYLTPNPDHLHVFDSDSGDRLVARTAV
ncbi:TOBE domain-containing protein, partial [Amnibacterium flavum]